MPRSRRPPDHPEVFIDHSLGRHQLAEALQEVGFVVHTVVSVFGQPNVADVVWLERAGREGWLVFSKDSAIRRRPAELEAVQRYGVRLVCLTTQGMTGPQQVERFIANINRILQRAHKPGPWICAVYKRRLVQIWRASASDK